MPLLQGLISTSDRPIASDVSPTSMRFSHNRSSAGRRIRIADGVSDFEVTDSIFGAGCHIDQPEAACPCLHNAGVLWQRVRRFALAPTPWSVNDGGGFVSASGRQIVSDSFPSLCKQCPSSRRSTTELRFAHVAYCRQGPCRRRTDTPANGCRKITRGDSKGICDKAGMSGRPRRQSNSGCTR